MFAKKLSAQEIQKAIEKIRQEYNHYIVHFGKTPVMKDRFEQRLREADLRRMDMTGFLGIEVQIVRELIQKEQDRLAQEELESERPKKPVMSYADRVMARLQKQIESYPRLEIHPEASTDVEKLYGTLQWFHQRIWGELRKGLKKRIPPRNLSALESELDALVPYQSRLPKELVHYKQILESPSRTIKQVTNQQNFLIKTGSFFLHRIYRQVLRVHDELKIPGVEGAFYVKTLDFLRKTIEDFRLKDLVPQEN